MKNESLQVKSSETVTSHSTSDFVTEVFHHQEIVALCRNGKPSARDKALVLIAGEVKEKQLYGQQQRAAPERLFKMAFFHRMFGGGSPIYMQPTLAEVKPKTFWDRLNAATLLPILVALTLAIAAWKTSEINSWKSTSEAGKELVVVLKQQLEGAQGTIKTLSEKNDGLQNDIKDALKDQNTDLAATKQKLIDALNKSKNQSQPKSTNQVAPQSDSGNKS